MVNKVSSILMKSNFPDWIQQHCANSIPYWNWNMLHLIIGNFLSKKLQNKRKPNQKTPFEWERGAPAGIF